MSNKVKIEQVVDRLQDALIIRGQQIIVDSTGYGYANGYMVQQLISIIDDLPVAHQKRILNQLQQHADSVHNQNFKHTQKAA